MTWVIGVARQVAFTCFHANTPSNHRLFTGVSRFVVYDSKCDVLLIANTMCIESCIVVLTHMPHYLGKPVLSKK